MNFPLFLLDLTWAVWLLLMWNAPVTAFALERDEQDAEYYEPLPSAPEGDGNGGVKTKIMVSKPAPLIGHGLRKR